MRYRTVSQAGFDGVGGAETFSVSLAERFRILGADVDFVFIGDPSPLADRLLRAGIRHHSLGLARGRDVLRQPRRYASEVRRHGPDGALLVERGFMGAALRMGGYRPPIVAVEHGPLLFEGRDFTGFGRLARRANRLSGARTVDAEVAVSEFMLAEMRRHSHARLTRRIYNGVDPERLRPAEDAPARAGTELVVGFVGRLIPGKGSTT